MHNNRRPRRWGFRAAASAAASADSDRERQGEAGDRCNCHQSHHVTEVVHRLVSKVIGTGFFTDGRQHDTDEAEPSNHNERDDTEDHGGDHEALAACTAGIPGIARLWTSPAVALVVHMRAGVETSERRGGAPHPFDAAGQCEASGQYPKDWVDWPGNNAGKCRVGCDFDRQHRQEVQQRRDLLQCSDAKPYGIRYCLQVQVKA